MNVFSKSHRYLLLKLLVASGRQHYKVGNSRFFGSLEHIEDVKKAVSIIAESDLFILKSLTAANLIFYNVNGRRVFNYKANIFCVEKGWLEWKEIGMVALIVFVVHKSDDSLSCAYKKTAEWLRERNFPEEVIDTFKSEE
jgi:hypothetical protein